MKNRDKYTEFDCPYRDNNFLGDKFTCSQTFGCSKGFDPGTYQLGMNISDIVCWLDQKCKEENK